MSYKFQTYSDQNLSLCKPVNDEPFASCFEVELFPTITGGIAKNSFASSFQGLCKSSLTVVLAPFSACFHLPATMLAYRLSS